ncbi:MAG: uncharacterized protein PWQ89_1223 [Verrucomicrobiota bacterium]|jgi:uncharacterized protein YggE|nr:uncharacterized protein [Verrucomicrobiota bacterium]
MDKSMLCCLLLTLTGPLFAEVELNGTPSELTGYLSALPETVMIEGSAEKKLPADRAVVHLKVTTESRSLDDALAKNQTLREAITTRLTDAGFPLNRIQADQFSSTPESGFFTDKTRSYKVENLMKAVAVNETEFRAIASLIDAHDEVTYEKTDFELSTQKEMERLVLAEACRDAVAKKALYEIELQVTLTPVRFNDGRISLVQPQLLIRRKMQTNAAVTESVSNEPPVQFDELEFKANVTVEYRLETD